jgi:hypothetical protein
MKEGREVQSISLTPFLFSLNIHCIWSRASDLFRATAFIACLSIPLTKRGVGGKANSDWLFRATPSRDSQLWARSTIPLIFDALPFLVLRLRFSPSNMR